MKNLLFLLLIILSACKDDEALNVFIENEANRTNNSSQKQSQITKNKLSNVSLYGKIKNGKGITIRLESAPSNVALLDAVKFIVIRFPEELIKACVPAPAPA